MATNVAIPLWRRAAGRRTGKAPGQHLCPSAPSDQFKPKLAADQGGGPLQALDRHVALRLQDAIDLRPAGVHPFGERRLRDPLPLHFLGELPCDDARERLGLGRLADAVPGKEAVERRAPMGIFLRHAFISCIRRRARSRSSAGVFWAFLMNPWTTPIRPSSAKNS